MGGLIGGESRKLSDLQSSGKNIAGNLLSKRLPTLWVCWKSMLPWGSSFAPTAGSSGVIPGVLLALQEEYDFTDDQIIDALFTCSAIGWPSCHAQCNRCRCRRRMSGRNRRFFAMAAALLSELMGGTPEQCTDAASTVLYEHVGSCLRPGGWPGRISMPEPKCIRCIQRHCGR